ncbi:MAG: helix-turn-helix domain-containing protein [Notoacmeibacter sp.]
MEDNFDEKTDMKLEHKPANHIDVEIGQRIKQRRKSLSISQEKLGEALGVSFQQIQKYEKGINRVSVSSLKTIASFLDINPIFFYGNETSTEHPGFAETGDGFDIVKMLRDPELKELSRAFTSIKDETVRKTILDLVRSLSSTKQN